MNILQAMLLGLVQGLTEFLPVSSSGHLVIGEALLGVKNQGIIFEVALHLATAGAVILAYRKRIGLIIKAFLSLVKTPAVPLDEALRKENLRLGWFVILGTIPAGIIGVAFKDCFEAAFSSPRMVSGMLLGTGAILMLSRFAPKTVKPINWRSALGVGLAQAVAILPGISRSGSTISAGLLLGLGPGRSAEFSFLLALPAILGAGVIEAAGIFSQPYALEGINRLALFCGAFTAFVSGFAAIYALLRLLQRGRFDRFAWYVWAVGAAGLWYF